MPRASLPRPGRRQRSPSFRSRSSCARVRPSAASSGRIASSAAPTMSARGTPRRIATVRCSTIAVLGLTFKPNTDDMREAPSIALITALQDAGAKVRAYDPEGMKQARAGLENVEYAEHAYACIDGADALVIVTEWDAFRALDLDRVKSLLKRPIVVDLRNIYRPQDMAGRGFTYVGIGRAGPPREPHAGGIQSSFDEAPQPVDLPCSMVLDPSSSGKKRSIGYRRSAIANRGLLTPRARHERRSS